MNDGLKASSIDYTSLSWRKSSFSGTSDCVELAALPAGGVAVRDTKLGDKSPVLSFTPREIDAFLKGLQAGEFTDLSKA